MRTWRAAGGLPVINLDHVIQVDRRGRDPYAVRLSGGDILRLGEADGDSLVRVMMGEPSGDLASELARIPVGFHLRIGREIDEDDGREFYCAFLHREVERGPDEVLWATGESASDWPTFERLLVGGLARQNYGRIDA